MKVHTALASFFLLFGGCAVKVATSEHRSVYVPVRPFEKARAKQIARQFLLAYCGGEPKQPNELAVSKFTLEGASLSLDSDNWDISFHYWNDPIILNVTLNRDMKRAYVELNDADPPSKPAIDGDDRYHTQRTLEDFRRQLDERRKLKQH